MLAETHPRPISKLPKLPFYVPIFNHVVRSFLRVGVPLGNVGLLAVEGRRTGKTRRNPVGLFEHNGRHYLFSTFGDVNWVRNARAAKFATIRKGLKTKRVVPIELSLSEAAVVLKETIAPAFLGLGGKVFGSHFPLRPDDSIDKFVEEAKRHPMFELRKAEKTMTPSIDSNILTRPEWVDNTLYPFKDNWIFVDRNRIHYVDEGPRDAPTMLFVHPGAGWSFTYRYHIQELKDRFRCVAPDLPGYGMSVARDGYGYTLLEQARVLEEFIEALDLRRVVAWGNDGGGPTMILALADHMDRVSGLVVGGTFGWSVKPYRTGVVWPLRFFTSRMVRLMNRYTNLLAWSMGSKMALGTRTLTKVERRQYTRPFKDRDSRNRTLRLYASFLDEASQAALDEALPALREKPVLIQFGDKDAMTSQHWPERWAKEAPNSRTIILPGVRHFTFEGAPEATVKNFREWWTDTIERTAGVSLARLS